FCRSTAFLSALLLSTATLAASETDGSRPPAQTESPAVSSSTSALSTMRERMHQIRRTSDPELRRQLMEEQMEDMETIGQAGSACPMVGAPMMGAPMMGAPMMGGPMMRGGMGGSAMEHPEVLRQ